MSDLLNMTVGQSSGRIKVYCRTRQLDAKAMSERGGCCVECGGAEHDEITVNYKPEKTFSLQANNQLIQSITIDKSS